MAEAREILNEIVDGPGIKFAALVSRDGFVIENSATAGPDDEMAAATVSSILGAVGSIGKDLGFGQAEQLVMQYEGGRLMIQSVGPDSLLVAAFTNEANMAWIRYAFRKYRRDLSEVL